MGDPAMRRAACLLLAALLLGASGCTMVGQLRRALRHPGEELVSLPGKVEEKYDCESRHLPYFVLERNEINPDRLRPGAEFNHRLVYALCPTSPTAVVVGKLRTRIRFRGRVLVDDRGQRFEIKPGRWAVDAFVRLPDDAEAGVYALEVDFESKQVAFSETATFGVDGAPVR